MTGLERALVALAAVSRLDDLLPADADLAELYREGWLEDRVSLNRDFPAGPGAQLTATAREKIAARIRFAMGQPE